LYYVFASCRVEEPSYTSEGNSSGAKLMFMLGKSPPSKAAMTIDDEAPGGGNTKVGQPSQRRWADDDDEVHLQSVYVFTFFYNSNIK
jgi:hypothetical protein